MIPTRHSNFGPKKHFFNWLEGESTQPSNVEYSINGENNFVDGYVIWGYTLFCLDIYLFI